MITIKKYPNRRLYNTSTSSYINLDGIQQLILDGETVLIVDSKTNENVTTATLLLHALEPEVIEAQFPSEWMQALMRMGDSAERIKAIKDRGRTVNTGAASRLVNAEPDSETQAEERTVPRVDINIVQSESESLESVSDSESESNDSDSEVTVVRLKAPPTQPFDSSNVDMPSEQDPDEVSKGGEPPEGGIPSFWSDPDNEVLGSDEVLESVVQESNEVQAGEAPLDVAIDVDGTDVIDASDFLDSSSDDLEVSEAHSVSAELSEQEAIEVLVQSEAEKAEPVAKEQAEKPSNINVNMTEAKENEQATPSLEPAANEPSNNAASIKSQKMAARLAAMRAKLNR